MKEVTVNDQRQIGCLSGVALVAIDYFGASPAAEMYFWMEGSVSYGRFALDLRGSEIILMSATC